MFNVLNTNIISYFVCQPFLSYLFTWNYKLIWNDIVSKTFSRFWTESETTSTIKQIPTIYIEPVCWKKPQKTSSPVTGLGNRGSLEASDVPYCKPITGNELCLPFLTANWLKKSSGPIAHSPPNIWSKFWYIGHCAYWRRYCRCVVVPSYCLGVYGSISTMYWLAM